MKLFNILILALIIVNCCADRLIVGETDNVGAILDICEKFTGNQVYQFKKTNGLTFAECESDLAQDLSECQPYSARDGSHIINIYFLRIGKRVLPDMVQITSTNKSAISDFIYGSKMVLCTARKYDYEEQTIATYFPESTFSLMLDILI
jgi:hypothetical protein